MEFQQLTMTLVNTAMIMATVLLLRERVARNRRKHANDQELIMGLSEWDKKHIPFWRRKSRNQTFIVLAILGAFLIWIGFKNVQAMVESLIMGVIAGGMVIYMRKLDEKKEIGAYTKGILHKTGFVYYSNISSYKTSESDEYENACDVWLMIGNTPRIQVHVPNSQIKAFEKLIRKNIRLTE